MKNSKVVLGKWELLLCILVINKSAMSFHSIPLYVSVTGLDLNFLNSTLFSFMWNNTSVVWGLEVPYSRTDAFVFAFCLIPVLTFMFILILNVLLVQKHTQQLHGVTPGFHSYNYTSSSTSLVYDMQLDCKLSQAGLLIFFLWLLSFAKLPLFYCINKRFSLVVTSFWGCVASFPFCLHICIIDFYT